MSEPERPTDQMWKTISRERAIARLLAVDAYENRRVRLTAERDLTGLSHIVSTRNGLFAIGLSRWQLLAHGSFFGLTLRDGAAYVFECCDHPQRETWQGRLLRIEIAGGRIGEAIILAEGLSNSCHQMDFVDDELAVLDTSHQRVLLFGPDGAPRGTRYPLAHSGAAGWSAGYAHVNSILASRDEIFLLLHNGGKKTGAPSEIVACDHDWQRTDSWELSGGGCHNFILDETGGWLACASLDGALICSDGRRVGIGGLMTRGLSVGADQIVVGESTFSNRMARRQAIGRVSFLSREMSLMGRLDMPASPCDIRRLDGKDLGLSDHSAALGISRNSASIASRSSG